MADERLPDPGPESRRSGDRTTAAVAGLVGALVVGVAMLLLRWTLQVRSVPERLLEWLLLFVPPNLFESVLQQYGFDAKRYALYLATIAVLGAFACLGYLAVGRRWSFSTLAVVGVGVWLAVMLVVMPLTSAGVFATALLDGKRAAIGGYLALGLSYSAALGLFRAWTLRPFPSSRASRRHAFYLVGAAAASFVASYLAVRLLPHAAAVPAVLIDDTPQAVQSDGLEPPDPDTDAAYLSGAKASAQPTTGNLPVAALPEPTSTRQLARDNDGAVVAGTRQPGQLAEPVTPNRAFYVVTKNAAGDPYIHPSDWHVLVDGEVKQSFKLDYATLRRLPAVQVTKTLECISNFVGKPELAPFGADLISTALWTGAPVRDILGLVGGPGAAAAWAVAFGADEFTSVLPIEAVMDPTTLLVYEMNGEVLPREHGYPARLLVPDRYGMKNAKWLTGLRLMQREVGDWFGQRDWSKTAIVQTMCRIDTPAPGAQLAAGTHTVAGIAYAGTRGLEQVEFSVDDGSSWRGATLSRVTHGEDQWVAWRGSFDLVRGQEMTILARATDGTGVVQPQAFTLPQPDGGSGWAQITVREAS